MSHVETHPWAFYGMTGFATALATIVAWSGLRRYVDFSIPTSCPTIFLDWPRYGKSDSRILTTGHGESPGSPSRCDTGRLMDGHDTERDILFTYSPHLFHNANVKSIASKLLSHPSFHVRFGLVRFLLESSAFSPVCIRWGYREQRQCAPKVIIPRFSSVTARAACTVLGHRRSLFVQFVPSELRTCSDE
jgi:hypothetical protein